MSARSSEFSSAMGIPSHGIPARGPASRKSVWRNRKSMLSLPSARTKRAANASSSSVECGDTRAPTALAPCFATTSESPFATYSSAVCQSAFFRIERFVREAVLVGEPAFIDRLVLERKHAHHAIDLDLHDQIAAQPIVR